MNWEDLELWREGWDFEAKLAAGRDGMGTLPDSFWESYSAMANTEGGLILLGAKEHEDGSLELRGLGKPEQVENDLWNTLDNAQKVSANVLRREDVQRLERDGKVLLLIQVPKAPRAQRPVYLKGSWERGTYLRVHQGDRLASSEVARRMLADSFKDRDSEALEEMTADDLHLASIERYREMFAVRRPEHPFLRKTGHDFLVDIGALKRERRSVQLRPTWAGLLMLGEENAIREILPHWHLSYKEVPEDPADTRRWLDRLHSDGTWNGNLFEFYLRCINKLHDGLKVPFSLESGQFRVDETPVHAALREALVNTLIHGDSQGPTGIRALKRRSGFEFINPACFRSGTVESVNVATRPYSGFSASCNWANAKAPAVRPCVRPRASSIGGARCCATMPHTARPI